MILLRKKRRKEEDAPVYADPLDGCLGREWLSPFSVPYYSTP
jgi:hypothetical protein